MKLVVLHYHDRPGGVRQVITSGLPGLAAAAAADEIVMLGGQWRDGAWQEGIGKSLGRVPVRWVGDAALGYRADAPEMSCAALQERITEVLREVLAGGRVAVWAHNLGLARNVPLTRALPAACARAGADLWLHHHDWWFDGRWERWADWQEAGVCDFAAAVAASVPGGPRVRHWCVSVRDSLLLRHLTAAPVCWTGNPPAPAPQITAEEAEAARAWLHGVTGGHPAWLAPTRYLRRKNLAEALLLTRALAPGHVLVTTGGPSSPREAAGFAALTAAAGHHGWPLRAGVLAGPPADAPGVPALLSAAEAILLPGLQEGFGLGIQEAAALRRPLLWRRRADGVRTLGRSGAPPPPGYAGIPVPRSAFDAPAEAERVHLARLALRSLLPPEFAALVPAGPIASAAGGHPDFGTLSLAAQCEVLSAPLALPRAFPHPLVPRAPEVPGASWGSRALQSTPLPTGRDPSPQHAARLLQARFRHWLRHPLLWM